MITTVIFDVGGVQITGLRGVEDSITSKLNLKRNEATSNLEGQHLDDFCNGRISEEEYLTSVIKDAGWSTNPDELKRGIRENFKEIDGTREILDDLKASGFKLGILSIHGKEWVEYILKKFDLGSVFDAMSYSYQVGISKPDPQSYQIIMQELGSKPEECLFIDDTQQNISAAKRLGMHAILFVNAQQLREDMSRLGINLKNRRPERAKVH
jgi:epoxide hydrolase-like predicted phosphatase